MYTGIHMHMYMYYIVVLHVCVASVFNILIYIYMYTHSGGRQFKVTPNDLIVVNKIPADIGSEIYLEKVQIVQLCDLHDQTNYMWPDLRKGGTSCKTRFFVTFQLTTISRQWKPWASDLVC